MRESTEHAEKLIHGHIWFAVSLLTTHTELYKIMILHICKDLREIVVILKRSGKSR